MLVNNENWSWLLRFSDRAGRSMKILSHVCIISITRSLKNSYSLEEKQRSINWEKQSSFWKWNSADEIRTHIGIKTEFEVGREIWIWIILGFLIKKRNRKKERKKMKSDLRFFRENETETKKMIKEKNRE